MSWSVTANPERFDEALASFRRRVVLEKHEALALGDDAAERAFWIGGGLHLTQVGRVFDEIETALESGEPFEEFRKRVRLELRDDAHAETVFRNAVQHSYSAGRYRQMTEPSVLRFRPFWMHDSVLDSATTVECRTLDGKVFPADHPHWRTHWAPGHHRCRRSIRSLRKSEAERRGIETQEPDVEFGPGWARLPSSQPIWKPKKGKGGDQDKLVDALGQKTETATKKSGPKGKPATPAAAPASPLRQRAQELGNAVSTGDWRKARAIVDQHIESVFPGAQSKDRAWNRIGADRVEIAALNGANGVHGWDGVIGLAPRSRDQLLLAAQHLAAGTYDSPELWKLKGVDRFAKWGTYSQDPMWSLVGGFRTMVHESLHGYTRIAPHQYRGAVAVLEEVGVELNARRVIRGLTEQTQKAQAKLDGGSYADYIDAIEGIFSKHAPSLSKDLSGREHFAQAFESAILGPASAPFGNSGQYIDAIVDALDVPAGERDQVRSEFRKLRATHLPPPFQD